MGALVMGALSGISAANATCVRAMAETATINATDSRLISAPNFQAKLAYRRTDWGANRFTAGPTWISGPVYYRDGKNQSSIGTMAASLELRSVSEVFTLRTLGAAVSFSTKAWKVFKSGATHLSTKSISPESIQHSRTSGCARTNASKAARSGSAWLARCTMANTATS